LSFYLFWPDESQMVEAGFGNVADIPAVFDGRWAYQEAPSKYLRERTLRDFLPRNARRSVNVLTPASIQTFGESLCNFLEWCELRELDWRLLEYKNDIIQGYQKALSAGTFSVGFRGLSSSTINSRVDEACNFLQWAFGRGLRREFHVPTVKIKVKHKNSQLSHGHKTQEIEVREGRVRADPKSLRMPSQQEIKLWLESLRVEKGVTKHLMAELILYSAVRREEVIQWQVDTLPENREDWHITGNEVAVKVEYGAKGMKRYNERGDLVGPSRIIFLPLELAEKLHLYRETKRLKFFAAYVKSAKTPRERSERMNKRFSQLFLSDFTGKPVSAQTFYDAWVEASRLPFKGWSPHPGRHYWACNELLQELDRKFSALKNLKKSEIPIDWISGNVQDIIKIRIQPQLGHIDEETTERYIAWAIQQYRCGDIGDRFEQALES